ncbi:MAG: type 1 glutamine amidotransferase [Pseudomonadota bacterium]
MLRILIVESNTPDMVERSRADGFFAPTDCFVNAMSAMGFEIDFSYCNPYQHSPESSVYDDLDGVIFTGSGVEWSTDAPQAEPLRDAMEAVFRRSLPTYGSCNGMQLAAVVLGGAVAHSPNGQEVGVARIIRLTESLNGHPMLNGRADAYFVPTIHRDEVSVLPAGAVHLACNSHSANQAFAYTRDGVDFWGTQYHPEMRPLDVGNCPKRDGDAFEKNAELAEDLLRVQDDSEAAARLGTTPAEMQVESRALELRNWLVYLDAKSRARTAA